MSKLILDGRRREVQAFMKLEGSRLDFVVSASDTEVFQPDLEGKVRIYGVRSNAKIFIAGHNSSHLFNASIEPPLEAAEEDLIVLDGDRRDRISMRAAVSTAVVSIYEMSE